MNFEKVHEKLIKIVGEENVSVDVMDLICYSRDASEIVGLPQFVTWPLTAEQVSEIVKLANEEKIPVVPRTAGTSLSGGPVPVNGGIVVDLSKMNTIIEIDERNFTALVEPGVVVAELNEQLERRGLFFPPTPASDIAAAIGGSIAVNAGGIRAVKYGVIGDWVLGLEVVLPTGDIIWTRKTKARKCVSGYDLTKLMVGSEGTLGIITKALLAVHPLPEARLSALAYFKTVEEVVECVYEAIRRNVDPSAAELMDRYTLIAVSKYTGLSFPGEAGAAVLFEVDGMRESVERRLIMLESIFKKLGAIDYQIAKTPEENAFIWKSRKAALAAIASLRPSFITCDATVPIEKLSSLLNGIEKIARRYDLLIPCFGHAGDGNIHPMILFDEREKSEVKKAYKAVEDIVRVTLELGGTITGEHGVGASKIKFIEAEHGVTLEVMKRIKKTLDPNNIMNPGKVF